MPRRSNICRDKLAPRAPLSFYFSQDCPLSPLIHPHWESLVLQSTETAPRLPFLGCSSIALQLCRPEEKKPCIRYAAFFERTFPILSIFPSPSVLPWCADDGEFGVKIPDEILQAQQSQQILIKDSKFRQLPLRPALKHKRRHRHFLSSKKI